MDADCEYGTMLSEVANELMRAGSYVLKNGSRW